ncbi:ATPase AAA [Planctomycetota bacterium]|nr:ATPase AAA [Planctomycetota bacterium]
MATQADDQAGLARLAAARSAILGEIGKAIVGQADVVDQVLLCILARSHAILEGVPGLAKTLLVSSLARTMSAGFSRIQFTPDLMPSDITGTEVIQEDRSTGARERRFLPGPIFANLVLADEINRTPPKTQAALLEAMQERQVTIGAERHPLPDPFFVLATQNPLEQEGTYPLPEAQQDRFLFKILVDYPSWDDEMEVVRRTTSDAKSELKPVLDAAELIALQGVVRRVAAADHLVAYALRLVRATRPGAEAPAELRGKLAWGAGPRAAQGLVLAAKARAALAGRGSIAAEDITAIAAPVLRHRIQPSFEAAAEGLTAERIVANILRLVEAHPSSLTATG